MSLSNCMRAAGPLLVLWVAACDPMGPGAIGQVHVPDGTSYQGLSLELRTYPDDGAPFDLAAVPITDAATARNTIGLDTPPPWDYRVGEPVGTTSQRHWRVVAWLSAEGDVETDRIPSGTPYGTTTFDIHDCGFPISGYCEYTDNVDIVLDQRAPGS